MRCSLSELTVAVNVTPFVQRLVCWESLNQDGFVCPEKAVPSAAVYICPLLFLFLVMDERVLSDWLFSFSTQAVNSLVMSR